MLKFCVEYYIYLCDNLVMSVGYNDFLNYLENERNYSKLTVKSYREDLEEFLCITKLNDVYCASEEDIKKYYKYLYNKSSSTVARKISTLKSYFKYLSKNSNYDNLMVKFKLPKRKKSLPTFLNYSDLEELINASGEGEYGERNRLVVEMLYATGVRVSELVNVKLSDVDFNEKMIRIHGKGNKERFVFYGEYCEEALSKYINGLRRKLIVKNDTDFLFLNKYGGKISDRSIRSIIDTVIKKTSVKMNVHPHTLRHTFATHLLTQGIDLKSVQFLLGHENLSSTEIYTHVTDEMLRNVYLHSHPRSEEEHNE